MKTENSKSVRKSNLGLSILFIVIYVLISTISYSQTQLIAQNTDNTINYNAAGTFVKSTASESVAQIESQWGKAVNQDTKKFWVDKFHILLDGVIYTANDELISNLTIEQKYNGLNEFVKAFQDNTELNGKDYQPALNAYFINVLNKINKIYNF